MSKEKYQVKLERMWGILNLGVTHNGYQWSSIPIRHPEHEIPLMIKELEKGLKQATPTKPNQIVDADHIFKFDPAKIACPICGAPIVGHFEAWEKTEDGNWQGAEHIKLDCTWEPDINSDEWEDWFESHWSTPYIDWLPLEIRLGEYINKKYRFKI